MAFATIPSWSTTAGTNTELDGISLAENVMVPSAVNNAFREMMSQVAEFTRRGSDLATASTLDLDSIDTMFLDLTGTITVTAVTLTDGHSRRARAVGAFQLTASSSLIVNGSTSTNYTTTAGDLLFFEGYSGGVVRVWVLGSSAAATTSAAGIVELATDAEAQAGIDTARALTPSNLAAATYVGSVVQSVFGSYASNADLTTAIPMDDTIPQNTEGTQIISVSITPKNTTNKLRLRFHGQATAGGAGRVAVAAFLNSTANAIAATNANVTATDLAVSLALEWEFVPGSTSAQTIAIRAGGNVTMRMNGQSATRLFGGVSAAALVVEEIKAS